MDRGPWWATVHGVAKESDTTEQLSWAEIYKRLPGGSGGKESASNVGDPGLIPELGSSLGEGNDYSVQYSCLENSMDRGPWWATVHGVAKSWTQLSRWARSPTPENLMGYSFIIKGEVGRGRKSLSFLSRYHDSIMNSSRLGKGGFSLHSQTRSVHKLLFFYVCKEHVLKIANLLSSQGSRWVSYHHYFIVWGHVLHFSCMVMLLSNSAWFY